MPRLGEVGRDDAHELAQVLYTMLFGDRDPVVEPGTETGTPGNWWTVTALVPDLFDHIVGGFAFYRDPKRKLPAQLRELGQTRAGYACGSRFVYSQHVKACREVGLTETQVDAIPAWSVADCFSPVERAVLAYTDALVLTYITCTYDMHATMSRALRLEYDDVDDPISEVPAPDGASLDAMGVVDDLG